MKEFLVIAHVLNESCFNSLDRTVNMSVPHLSSFKVSGFVVFF